MGIHHSSHTHPIPIPMGIPIRTAALPLSLGAPAAYVLWGISLGKFGEFFLTVRKLESWGYSVVKGA